MLAGLCRDVAFDMLIFAARMPNSILESVDYLLLRAHGGLLIEQFRQRSMVSASRGFSQAGILVLAQCRAIRHRGWTATRDTIPAHHQTAPTWRHHRQR